MMKISASHALPDGIAVYRLRGEIVQVSPMNDIPNDDFDEIVLSDACFKEMRALCSEENP